MVPNFVLDTPNVTRWPSLIFGLVVATVVVIGLVLVTRELWRTMTEGEA